MRGNDALLLAFLQTQSEGLLETGAASASLPRMIKFVPSLLIKSSCPGCFCSVEWEDVQEALGLLSPEEIEDLHRRREAEQRAHMEAFDRAMEKAEFWGGGATPSDTYWRQTPRTPAAKKAKHKQKLSKQAWKKNRKH